MTMKMTKRDLKLMMKECIIELIQEGAFANAAPVLQQQPTVLPFAVPQQQQQFMLPQQQQPMMLANPAMLMPNNPFTGQPAMMEAMTKQAAAQFAQSMAGGNQEQARMMQSIFEDTIKNTLPRQATNGQQSDMISENITAGEVQKNNQELNSVGDVSRWKKLAFANRSAKLPGQRGPNDDDLG